MKNQTQVNNLLNDTVLNTDIVNNDTMINETILNNETNIIGAILDGKYEVKSKMNIPAGEADLYICTNGNEDYVAKIYRRKVAIKEEIIEELKKIESPYVAKIYATGHYHDYPYEILPYYKNGSLKGKKYSYEQLKTQIIPALNEGLNVLHNNGIIHKDLKPSNIMLADNGQDVIIIDFGISSMREDGNTVIVTKTGMTPEYSAPETFKNLFLNESDYYSLGITLFELYCGRTPYAEMSQNEIEKYVAVQKLPLPNDMQDELKVLISALTYPDITNRKKKTNPNRRWGYEEILKWCVGIKQPIPGEMVESTTVSGDIKPYKFLGKTYTNKGKLVAALGSNWNDGKKQLFRGLLSAYFKDFDAEIAGFCMDAEDEVSSGDEDLIFFKTLYKIDPSMSRFYWKGKMYEDVVSFGNELLEKLWVNDRSMIAFVDEILVKGVLSSYVLCLDEKDKQRAYTIKTIESSYTMFRSDSRQKKINCYLLAYMLSGRKNFYNRGIEFENIQDLIVYMKELLECSYEEFENMCNDLIDYNNNLDPQFESWLIALGKKESIANWRKNIH